MQGMSSDDKSDIRQGDEPKVESRDVPGHLNIFMWRTSLDIKQKLCAIMEHRDHMVFSDTLNELICEEFERASLRIRMPQSKLPEK